MNPRTHPSNHSHRFRQRGRTGFALAGLAIASLLFGSCGGANPAGPERERIRYMLTLVAVSGNNQALAAGGVQSAPLVVATVDQNGTPIRGMVIDWTLEQGTGTLSAPRSTSDASGQVQVTYTSGAETGETIVHATFNAFATGATAARQIDPVRFTIAVE